MITPETSRFILTLYMVIVGLGVGFSFSVLSMAAIHSFGFDQRGSATSTNNFVRSIGMTLGITIFGMIQKNSFQHQLEKVFAKMGQPTNGATFGDSREILSAKAREHIPTEVLNNITSALSSSIVHTFLWALVPAVFAFLFVFIMGKEQLVIEKKSTNGETI